MSSSPQKGRGLGHRVRRSPARGPWSWRRVPVAAWTLAACLLAGAVWFGVESFRSGRVTLEFVRRDGGAVPPLQLTFFPDQLAFAAPSPPPSLGQLQLAAASSITVARDLVPGHAAMRYEGAGIGTGMAFVRLGQALPPIELRAPCAVRGRVGEPIGFWCMGWRCAGMRPVAGAEVVAMGGGEHGIPLGSAITDAEGRFEITGLDSGPLSVALRVRAAGFAIDHLSLPPAGRDAVPPVVALVRTEPRSGRVLVPAGIDPTSLRVLARGLPGVEARPAADGTFVLDHVPPGLEPRLLLFGLPQSHAQRPARATAKQQAQVEVVPAAIVRGRVVDAATKAPLGGALVFCGDDVTVRADAAGRFELTQLLPGDVEVQAQWQIEQRRRRPVVRSGRRRVQLEAGQVVDDFVVAID